MLTKKQLYQLSLKAYRDNQNAIDNMFQQGLEKGFQKGLKKGMKQCFKEGLKQGRFKELIEIATRLKQFNLPVEQIMEVTKLTREEIEKL